MTAFHASSRPRARFWLGPLPIPSALLAWGLLIVGWRTFVMPRLPVPNLKVDPAVMRPVDAEGARSVPHLRGSASPDALLVLGDSRAFEDISLRVLARHGIEPAGLLTNALAQLDDLLLVARTLEPRRLLVCLSPASIYAKPPPHQAGIDEAERSKRWMQRVDERLDNELDVLRQRLVQPLQPAHWGHRPADVPNPDAQTAIYRGLLAPRTHALREAGFAKLGAELRALQLEGWRIACLRLPVSPSLQVIEEREFPAVRFERLCATLEIPYLDLLGEPYDTRDGSHVLGRETDRLSAVIATWLNGLPGFLDP